jgi:NodT family efflux transporter outer membrane factor (OMF) lipoprotein
MITLLAEVARNYLELRGEQKSLAVARQNLAAQKETLELTQSMNKSGLVSELDVARGASEVATTASSIPLLQSQIRHSIHAISTLLGKDPNSLSAELEDAKPVPIVPPDVPVGLPSDLLRRRPDIRRAEQQLHAETARVGSARADFFPKFTLTGSAGLDSSSVSHLLDWESRYFLFSPTVTWPVFDAGRIASNVKRQESARRESLLAYRNTVLLALREVEDSLATYAAEQERRTALNDALVQSRRALDIARAQYQHGLADFLSVLDAQRTALGAEQSLTQSDETVATDLVALYKALGGGWELETNAGNPDKPDVW